MPCICSVCKSAGLSAPALRAMDITACCARPLGAVSPLERPSWFTAVDAIIIPDSETKLTPVARASRIKTPIASPRTYPSAAASIVLHRLSGESIPAAKNIAVASWAMTECAPHAAALRDKKENVSLVWAISWRNVVNGKYLPVDFTVP